MEYFSTAVSDIKYFPHFSLRPSAPLRSDYLKLNVGELCLAGVEGAKLHQVKLELSLTETAHTDVTYPPQSPEHFPPGLQLQLEGLDEVRECEVGVPALPLLMFRSPSLLTAAVNTINRKECQISYRKCEIVFHAESLHINFLKLFHFMKRRKFPQESCHLELMN